MKVKVRFKQRNLEYSQEYADIYNEGKEGESNWKYNWERGYVVDGLINFSEFDSETINLIGFDKDGMEVPVSFNDMVVIKCETEKGIEEFAVSKKLLTKWNFNKDEKYNIMRCYFYFKQNVDYAELVPGIYVPRNEIPN